MLARRRFSPLKLTCDLGLNLPLHLQRVDKNAAVADKAGAGYASVRLAESIFRKPVAERSEGREREGAFKVRLNNMNQLHRLFHRKTTRGQSTLAYPTRPTISTSVEGKAAPCCLCLDTDQANSKADI